MLLPHLKYLILQQNYEFYTHEYAAKHQNLFLNHGLQVYVFTCTQNRPVLLDMNTIRFIFPFRLILNSTLLAEKIFTRHFNLYVQGHKAHNRFPSACNIYGNFIE